MNEPPQQPFGEEPDEEEVVHAVLDYLAKHPHAMDTFEGIAQWWIPGQSLAGRGPKLASALDRLTRDGMLERIGSGESARYRLKK